MDPDAGKDQKLSDNVPTDQDDDGKLGDELSGAAKPSTNEETVQENAEAPENPSNATDNKKDDAKKGEAKKSKQPKGGFDQTPVPPGPPGYTIKITFHKATNLPVADLSTLSSDPFVVAQVYTALPTRHREDPPLRFRTPTIRRNMTPEWNAEWIIGNMPSTGFRIKARLYDEDPADNDDRLGNAHIHVPPFEEGWDGIREHPYRIEKRMGSKRAYAFKALVVAASGGRKKLGGELHVSIELLGRTKGDPGGRIYTIGPQWWTRHYSPVLGLITGSKGAGTASKDDDKKIERYNFQANQIQLRGPVPPELYHRYVEFRPFVKAMYTHTGLQGLVLNRALHHQHNAVYRFDRATAYGKFDGPSRAMTAHFLDLVHSDIGGRIFTYVITLDGLWRFTETGKEFGIDFLSKHTMHSDVNIYIAYSGEFFVRRRHGYLESATPIRSPNPALDGNSQKQKKQQKQPEGADSEKKGDDTAGGATPTSPSGGENGASPSRKHFWFLSRPPKASTTTGSKADARPASAGMSSTPSKFPTWPRTRPSTSATAGKAGALDDADHSTTTTTTTPTPTSPATVDGKAHDKNKIKNSKNSADADTADDEDEAIDPSAFELVIDNESGTYRPSGTVLPQLRTYLRANLPCLAVRTLDGQSDTALLADLKREQRRRKKAWAARGRSGGGNSDGDGGGGGDGAGVTGALAAAATSTGIGRLVVRQASSDSSSFSSSDADELDALAARADADDAADEAASGGGSGGRRRTGGAADGAGDAKPAIKRLSVRAGERAHELKARCETGSGVAVGDWPPFDAALPFPRCGVRLILILIFILLFFGDFWGAG